MPTIVGTIFFCFTSFFFVFRQDLLLGLLIAASIFQGSNALKFGTKGIPLFFMVEVAIVLCAIVKCLLRPGRKTSLAGGFWLALFGAISILSAFLYPFLFAGIPVYDPVVGIDLGTFIRPPLHFTFSNVTQSGFLFLHIATAYALTKIPYSKEKTYKAYLLTFYLLTFCVFAQGFCQITGIPFPDSVVRNNPDLWVPANSSGLLRQPATFMEPSFAGACLIMYTIGFLLEYLEGKGKAFRVILALAASGCVTSTGSLFTLIIFMSYLLIRYSPFRFPWYIHVEKGKRMAIFSAWLVVPAFFAAYLLANYQRILLEMTVSKGDSGSFLNRTTSDIYALGLLLHTYGIGVGLGSNRSSSLITSLVSNVGIAGSLAFAVFCFGLLSRIPKADLWIKWAALALLFNMCVDVPDVTFPVLWVVLLLALQTQRAPLQRGARRSTEMLPCEEAGR